MTVTLRAVGDWIAASELVYDPTVRRHWRPVAQLFARAIANRPRGLWVSLQLERQ